MLFRSNNRDWFESHRPQYQSARSEFEAFIAALIQELAPVEGLGGLSAKDCLFRLNRDLRFSKDKSPYKTHMSAYIAPGGRKTMKVGYYIQISPDGESIIAGGLYDPDPKRLAKFRQVIELVDLGGLSYREAAVTLSVPVGTVMSRVHRARSRIRAALEAGGIQARVERR